MKVADLCEFLESSFSLSLQEEYDNSGLLVGERDMKISNVLISLDLTEEIVQEAIRKNCNVIVSHHPIIFRGLKNLAQQNLVNRVLIACIRQHIAIYAIHTNLDNHFQGVNAKIAEKLNLKNAKILAPKSDLLEKLVVYLPEDALAKIDKAIFENGGGRIGNYSACHFRSKGVGTFMPNEEAKPTIGEAFLREEVDEYRVEYLIPTTSKSSVSKALFSAHPYEEVAHEWIKIQNLNQEIGSGMIGELDTEITVSAFLQNLKKTFNCGSIKYTNPHTSTIKKVAVCGGSGSFLLSKAIQAGADIFISSDFKYHDFFEADHKIIIADIGHFESEQFTGELIAEKLKEKFSTFAIQLTEINTNPINYL